MGYTTYFNQKTWTKKDKDGWEKALPIVKKILAKYSEILCFESDEPNKKPVANQETIRFNGIGDDGHETFYIGNEKNEFAFCKTARKPYDIAVCEISLILKAFCPNFDLSSDGFSGYVEHQKDGVQLDGFWNDAIQNVKEYDVNFHGEIEGTHGGRDGNPDPYCSFLVVLDK